MAQKNYLLGPSLLSDIRETISRVSAMPASTSASPRKQEHTGQVSTPQLIRIGTATGSWNKSSTNTVSWNPASGITATSVATNLFANITGNTATYSCAVARVGNEWYLISSPVSSSSTVSLATATATVVTDVSFAAVLSTSDCSIVVTKTLTTALITYVVPD